MMSTMGAYSLALVLASCSTRNHPPNTPEKPLGPATGLIGETLSYTTRTNDPDGDNVQIRFAWDDDTAGWSSFIPSGQSLSSPRSFARAGYHYVRVQGQDIYSARSIWAECSVLVSPAQSHLPTARPGPPVGPNVALMDSSCGFTVINRDPYADTICFRLSWGDGDTSGWSLLIAPGESAARAHVYDTTGRFLIRTQAWETGGGFSDWSESLPLLIHRPPGTPSYPYGPVSGVTDSTYSFSALCSDPDNDSVAVRFAWGDGSVSNWGPFTTSGRLAVVTQAFDTAGWYHFRAQSQDRWHATSGWSGTGSIAVSRAGLAIRRITFWCAPYPYGGLWGVTYGCDVFNVSNVVEDSLVIHAKLNNDFLNTSVIADSLTPGDSIHFGVSYMVHSQPTLDAIWADFR
jgi:hypothetical protein